METDTPKTGKIYGAITAIMNEIKAVTKNRDNTQGYKYRGVDDVFNEAHPRFCEHGVFITPEILEMTREERSTKSGSALISTFVKVKYTFYADDGSSVSCTMIGEGMDSGDKSAVKAQSIAIKYAIMQILMIPTLDPKDPETDNPEPQPKAAAKKKKASAEKKPWGAVVWHLPFGHNEDKSYEFKGHTLSEISLNAPKELAYWCRKWTPLADSRMKTEDDALREAMDECQLALAKKEAEPPAPQMDTVPMDTVEPTVESLAGEVRKLCDQYAIPEEWVLACANVKRSAKVATIEELGLMTLQKVVLNFNFLIDQYSKEQAK